jgi:hypothetical protein
MLQTKVGASGLGDDQCFQLQSGQLLQPLVRYSRVIKVQSFQALQYGRRSPPPRTIFSKPGNKEASIRGAAFAVAIRHTGVTPRTGSRKRFPFPQMLTYICIIRAPPPRSLHFQKREYTMDHPMLWAIVFIVCVVAIYFFFARKLPKAGPQSAPSATRQENANS